MCSRICVKNLPKYLTEERFRNHFESQLNVEVTDAKIMKRKDGKSREFGFVGFKTSDDAKRAAEYFHKTYLDTSKILVELAKPIGDKTAQRPWSKYSQGSSAHAEYIQQKQKKRKEATRAEEEKGKKKAKKPKVEPEVVDAKLQQFLDVMKPRSVSKIWSNFQETFDNPNVAIKKQKVIVEKKKVPERKPGGEGLMVEKTHIKFQDDSDEDLYEDVPNQDVDKANEEEELEEMDENPPDNEDKDDDLEVPSGEHNESDHKKVESNAEGDENDEKKDEDDKIDNKEVAKKEINKRHLSDEEDDDDISVTGRLFVRNLPFSATEDDLSELFGRFGNISEIHIPVDPNTKKTCGYAFILYVIPENAIRAMNELDGKIFQGRLLHIIPGKPEKKKPSQSNYVPKTHKEKKEMELKSKSQNDYNWSTLFMRSDAVASSIASRLGVKKSDILDRDSDNMAVRLAHAEAQIIEETKEVLEKEGVCLSTLSSLEEKPKRSKNIILVKNIPFETQESELKALFSQYGELARVVLPPAKTIALAEFLERNDAKQAFKSLAYTQFKHVPLYLEWAPVGIFKKPPKTEKEGDENETVTKEDLVEELENEEIPTATLYVKNLNWETTEETIRAVFEKVVPIRSVTIAKKKDVKNPGKYLSMGYGFVELTNKEDAIKAIKNLQKYNIDGHAIELKLSNRSANNDSKAKKATANTKKSTKILIRNLPFEASKKELRQLFKPFGILKSLRIPKKFDGSSRGFAFVEFLTKQEAANAMKSLGHAHLYGRHLVLEYAAEESQVQEQCD